MKLDIDQHVLDIDGTPAMEAGFAPDGSRIAKPVTLRAIITRCLVATPDGVRVEPEVKDLCFGLATRMQGDSPVEISNDDLGLIRARSAEFSSILGHGRIKEALKAVEDAAADAVAAADRKAAAAAKKAAARSGK